MLQIILLIIYLRFAVVWHLRLPQLSRSYNNGPRFWRSTTPDWGRSSRLQTLSSKVWGRVWSSSSRRVPSLWRCNSKLCPSTRRTSRWSRPWDTSKKSWSKLERKIFTKTRLYRTIFRCQKQRILTCFLINWEDRRTACLQFDWFRFSQTNWFCSESWPVKLDTILRTIPFLCSQCSLAKILIFEPTYCKIFTFSLTCFNVKIY